MTTWALTWAQVTPKSTTTSSAQLCGCVCFTVCRVTLEPAVNPQPFMARGWPAEWGWLWIKHREREGNFFCWDLPVPWDFFLLHRWEAPSKPTRFTEVFWIFSFFLFALRERQRSVCCVWAICVSHKGARKGGSTWQQRWYLTHYRRPERNNENSLCKDDTANNYLLWEE